VSAPTDAAVAIRDLRIQRGEKVVIPRLDAEVPAGQITGLLGPSGSGKTTLLRAIVGVQRILSGSVTVLGRPAGSAELRREVGYMTQAPSVYGDLTAAENLRFFARVLGVGEREIAAALETVGLEAERDQLVGSVSGGMSGGQRARVSLATALLGDPSLLILDEPTVGLDPVLRDNLWETFAGLARRGTTLVVSSHVMDEAERCDSLMLIREGELIATGAPDDLRGRVGAANIGDAFLRLIRERDQGADRELGR
jgi:ABC-2 type transport system ATP-binding protein